MIIGITGKSGSGKSYLSKIIANKLDAQHIDIDKISHEILSLSETISFVKQEFGDGVFENNQINRKKLGKIAFNNNEKLIKLNKFCQIQIEKKLDEIISSANKIIILDYALLCGLKHFELCDVKILLVTDFETRFARASKRENISRKYFLSRDKSIDEFKSINFDFIFNNISNEQIENLVLDLKIRSEHD